MDFSFLEQIPSEVYWAAAIAVGLVTTLGLVVSARLQRRKAAAARKATEVYQRTAWSFVKGLIAVPFAAAGIFIGILWVYQFWVPPEPWAWYALYGVPVAVALWVLLTTLFGESERFEIQSNGMMRYYKRSKLLREWYLPQCQVGYYHKTVGMDDDTIRFTIADDTGREETISCEALGGSQFHRMFDCMQSFSAAEPVELKTK